MTYSLKSLRKIIKGDPVVITALGDSLTYGWMTEKGYIDYLTEMIKKHYPQSLIKIINKGIPGDTASDGLRRLNSDVLSEKPDIVFIQFGLNDLFTGYKAEQFQNTIGMLINGIRNWNNADIILLTSVSINNPYENRLAEIFYSKIEETGMQCNIPVIKVHEYWNKKIREGIPHSQLVQTDGIHPTEKGYFLMAEAIMISLADMINNS